MNAFYIEHEGKLLTFNFSDYLFLRDLSDGFGHIYKKTMTQMDTVYKNYTIVDICNNLIKNHIDFPNNKIKFIDESFLNTLEKDYFKLLIEKDYHLEKVYDYCKELIIKQKEIIKELEKEHINNILL